MDAQMLAALLAAKLDEAADLLAAATLVGTADFTTDGAARRVVALRRDLNRHRATREETL